MNPNIQDAVGTTALLYAVTQRDIEFIKLLLAAGADVNVANQQGTRLLTLITLNWNRQHTYTHRCSLR